MKFETQEVVSSKILTGRLSNLHQKEKSRLKKGIWIFKAKVIKMKQIYIKYYNIIS